MSKASDQITEYLSVGGLFNPEIMNQTQHEAVRDTLIKARDDIQSLERENAALREDKERLTDAAEEVLNTYILTVREETGHPCPENLVICRDLRAAIDAARKEAQP